MIIFRILAWFFQWFFILFVITDRMAMKTMAAHEVLRDKIARKRKQAKQKKLIKESKKK